jgi:hypothetical protein
MKVIYKCKKLEQVVLRNFYGEMPNIQQLTDFVGKLSQLRYLCNSINTCDSQQLNQLCVDFSAFLNINRPVLNFSLKKDY